MKCVNLLEIKNITNKSYDEDGRNQRLSESRRLLWADSLFFHWPIPSEPKVRKIIIE